MSKLKYVVSLFIVLAVLVIPAISKSDDSSGAVYTMTDNASGNQVIRFDMGHEGTLSNPTYFATSGLGGGGIAGSNSGGLALSKDGKTLLVVNAGSNQITAFEVADNGLKMTDIVNSGGIKPISITINDNLVYVLNAGGSGNIVGFHLDDGKLTMISKSARPLSGAITTGADEVSFSPDGKILAVTETATNKIDTYVVTKDGLASQPDVQNSAGQTPFGFSFDTKGHLIDSEAETGTVGASTVSSYDVNGKGKLKTISASVPDFRTAACWLVVTDDGIAYTNNAHDGTTSSYTVSKSGKLTLLESIAATPGTANLDLALSHDNKFLYSLNEGSKTITGFKIKSDGSLSLITTVSVPAGADGLVSE
jgi:6-phosphogluconolactonase